MERSLTDLEDTTENNEHALFGSLTRMMNRLNLWHPSSTDRDRVFHTRTERHEAIDTMNSVKNRLYKESKLSLYGFESLQDFREDFLHHHYCLCEDVEQSIRGIGAYWKLDR